MSNYLAVRGVTETLRVLLGIMMETKVIITACPPDLYPGTGKLVNRVNLYLYKIVEDAYLKNQEIPGEGYPSDYGHPPLSLILYYLITAFPDKNEFDNDYDLTAQEILADAMRVFHDYPILTDSMEFHQNPGTKLLHSSLLNQFEKIKITPESLDTEELTKIWMGFNSPYRLSVGFSVSVVQVESKKARPIVKRVKSRWLHMMSLHRPRITDIFAAPPKKQTEEQETPPVLIPPASARIGDTLNIRGANFIGKSTCLIIGAVEYQVTPVSRELIKFEIKDDPQDPGYPKLQPGPTTVAVRVKRSTEAVGGGYDSPGHTLEKENIISSNQTALMLLPEITNVTPGSGTKNSILTVEGNLLYNQGIRTFVWIGDIAIEVKKPVNDDNWENPTPTKIMVPLADLEGLREGTYPVRVRANGAENLEEDKTFILS